MKRLHRKQRHQQLKASPLKLKKRVIKINSMTNQLAIICSKNFVDHGNMQRRVINCSEFDKFIYNGFRSLLIFAISNLYVQTGIFLLIKVIYFILVVYKKLAIKLEKEYLKSENITNSGRLFGSVSCCYSLWDY